MILAQATLAVEPEQGIDFSRWRVAFGLAFAGAFIAFYQDFNVYLQREKNSEPYDWKKMLGRVLVGAMAGAAIGFGINLTTTTTTVVLP